MAWAMKADALMRTPEPDGTLAPSLRVRLARSAADIRAAQRLRYSVFHEEMGARLPDPAIGQGLDVDPYDAIADHLLVEWQANGRCEVVGTYRLLRQSAAEIGGGFYSSGEFDLTPLLEHSARTGGRLLELGRSCVAPQFRNSATIQLLWRGIADYLAEHDISHLFGCASFPGIDVDRHAAALSYLHHFVLAPPHLRARAQTASSIDMNILQIGNYDRSSAIRSLPPLIRGYLRVGAMVGDGAWIDEAFGTIDVFVVMPVETIAARYSERFSAVRIAA
jgi:L-ornithine Nalpha-acyltransferase